MSKGNKPTGKKPQPHQDVPTGWQDRLEDFCRSNWQIHHPGEAFNLAAFTGISRKTLYDAKVKGWFTKSTFATLAQAVGCGTQTELMGVLSPPAPAPPTPLAHQPFLELQSAADRGFQLPPRNESELLVPYRCSIPVIGREPLLAGIQAWLFDTTRSVSVAIVAGRAGSGKTRLALELIRRLDTEYPGKWRCGFLGSDQLDAFQSQMSLVGWEEKHPVLAVVDYAAVLTRPLQKLLRALHSNACKPGPMPFRLLLLEREADFNSGWLQTLREVSYADQGIADFFVQNSLFRLEPFTDIKHRREILVSTLNQTAQLLHRSPVQVPELGANPHLDDQIASADFSDPLPLLMAGIVAARGDVDLQHSLSIRRHDLAFRIADHERLRIHSFAPPDPDGVSHKICERLAALATLAGGLNVQAATKLLSVIGKGYTLSGRERLLAECVQKACAGASGHIAPITPDLVGEAFAIRALVEFDKDSQRELIEATVLHVQFKHMLAAVIRTCQDYAVADTFGFKSAREAEIDLESFVRYQNTARFWLETLINCADDGDGEDLSKIFEHPALRQTDSLASARFEAAKRLVLRLDKLGIEGFKGKDQPTEWWKRGRVWRELAMNAHQEKNFELAEQSMRTAITAFGFMDSPLDDLGAWELATTLSHFGPYLIAAGKIEEGIATSKDAIRRWRELVVNGPKDLGPGECHLGGALANHAAVLMGLRAYEEALPASSEAIALLESSDPENEMFRFGLVQALLNHGQLLQKTGDTDGALVFFSKGATILDKLVSKRPDSYEGALATCLKGLARLLFITGDLDSAQECVMKAGRIYARLVLIDKKRFAPELGQLMIISYQLQQKFGFDLQEEIRSKKEVGEMLVHALSLLAHADFSVSHEDLSFAELGACEYLTGYIMGEFKPSEADLSMLRTIWAQLDGCQKQLQSE